MLTETVPLGVEQLGFYSQEHTIDKYNAKSILASIAFDGEHVLPKPSPRELNY